MGVVLHVRTGTGLSLRLMAACEGKTGEDLHSLLAFELAIASCTPLVPFVANRVFAWLTPIFLAERE